MRALLDVNVLIALLDGGHLHHNKAMTWLAQEVDKGWASCPLTQNGCLRIMAQPAYPNAVPVQQVAARLGEAVGHPAHQFWPDSLSLLDRNLINWGQVMGHRQVTDLYLLSLAVKQGGRFVTFDRRIDVGNVPGARSEQLVVLE